MKRDIKSLLMKRDNTRSCDFLKGPFTLVNAFF